MTKLWSGIAIVAALAGALAWTGTAKAVGQTCSAKDMLPEGKGTLAAETTESGSALPGAQGWQRRGPDR